MYLDKNIEANTVSQSKTSKANERKELIKGKRKYKNVFEIDIHL